MSKPSPTINNAVSVKNVRVCYDEHVILEDITFDIPQGSVAAVIGPNGSGKTTLIKAILGLAQTDKGSILLFDQPLDHVRSSIGYVPQHFAFDRHFPMTIQEFMELALHKHATRSAIERAIKDVGLKSTIVQHQLGTLSGGQLQRVLIAQAILNQPKLLVLDEPAAGIDMVGEVAFFQMIDQLRKRHHTTIIIVSHDITFVASAVDQVVCINKRLMCSGPPKHALTEKNLERLFGSSQILHHHHNE